MCEGKIGQEVVFKPDVYCICFYSLCVCLCDYPYSSCMWLGISLGFFLTVYSMFCVFVAASHRDGAFTVCGGVDLHPLKIEPGGLACGEVDRVLQYCWLMAFSAA